MIVLELRVEERLFRRLRGSTRHIVLPESAEPGVASVGCKSIGNSLDEYRFVFGPDSHWCVLEPRVGGCVDQVESHTELGEKLVCAARNCDPPAVACAVESHDW